MARRAKSPPLLVRIHGGPTAAARAEFSPSVLFWTSRGFAVVDVNYRGSTGYGRKFRDQLLGEWGVADVQDCIAAARFLLSRALLTLHGVSSAADLPADLPHSRHLFQQQWGFADTFVAACSLTGVTDLAALAADTHKFESRYLDGLVGPLPEAADTYRERSRYFMLNTSRDRCCCCKVKMTKWFHRLRPRFWSRPFSTKPGSACICVIPR